MILHSTVQSGSDSIEGYKICNDLTNEVEVIHPVDLEPIDKVEVIGEVNYTEIINCYETRRHQQHLLIY